jgi:hypothetical protein
VFLIVYGFSVHLRNFFFVDPVGAQLILEFIMRKVELHFFGLGFDADQKEAEDGLNFMDYSRFHKCDFDFIPTELV